MNELEIQVEFRRVASAGHAKEIDEMIAEGITPPRGALSLAASNGHIEVVKRLLKAKDYPKGELDEIATSVCDSIRAKHEDIARYLVEEGASPNAGTGRFLHVPALLLAAESGTAEFVKFLLDRGANPDAHDIPAGGDLLGINVNRTALMAAVEKGRIEIVSLLLEAGADPAIKGIKGKTAYELVAKRKDRQEIAKLLLNWRNKKTSGGVKPEPITTSKPNVSNKASGWKDALAILQKLCGTKPTPHLREKKIQVFALAAKRVKELIKKNKSEPQTLSSFDYNAVLAMGKKRCASAETSVFLSFDNGDAQICVAPWGDKFRTIVALKTGSANYGVDTEKLIAVFKKVDALCPFDLCECGTNSVGGSFTSPVKDAKKLAAILFGVCPFVVEEHSGKLVKFERHVKKERRFKLWWD